MTQYMLIFSLGPVQPFIMQARKTRDLWLGSFLLSLLMEAAMDDEDLAKVLVFPAPSKTETHTIIPPRIRGSIPDLPNKYVAVFDTESQAQKAAGDSKDRIKTCWETIHKDIWSKIIENQLRSRADIEIASAIWSRQANLDNFYEIFWVTVARDSQESYGDWLDRTQGLFDARKRLRDFKPQDEPGEKSTVSGEREVLHGVGTSRQDVQTFWYGLTKDRPIKDIAKDGTERLDAIDTIKRFAMEANYLKERHLPAGFPSTSSIATAPFVERLLDPTVDLSILQEWLDVTDKLEKIPTDTIPYFGRRAPGRIHLLKRDGDLFFPETFTSRRLEQDYGITPKTKAESLATDGSKALSQLLKATDALSIPRPIPYYAIIQMDGDNMGLLLSRVSEQNEHQKISQALSDFSRNTVPQLVEQQYPGKLVYAGGDDVFALAPLVRTLPSKKEEEQPPLFKNLLDLADQLQRDYCQRILDAVSKEEHKADVTASTGIAIAHHYTSLSYVRRRSKDAEDLAKKGYGKNALVVTVIRRSGEQTQVGCRWTYDGLTENDQPIEPIRLFVRFLELFIDDVLSPKCVHILLDEASTLVWLAREAQASEIKRILKRQRDDRQRDKLPDYEIEALAQRLSKLAATMDETHKHPEKSTELQHWPRYGLTEVLGWLLTMAFLARKEGD